MSRAVTLFLALLFAPFPWPSALGPRPLLSQSFDRTKPPVLAPPARLVLPTVRMLDLPNGVKVKLVEQHELPLLQVTVVSMGGSRLDGDRPGLATFLANMLDEGAGTRSAVELQSELAFLGASLQTFADWDRFTIGLKVPTRTMEPALDLLADVVLRPTFRTVELRRQRDLRLANLLQQRDDPGTVANLAFSQVFFPVGHPYHNSTGGDSASTATVDSATVRGLYERAITPRNTTIIVVGDITEARAREALAKRFGQWSSTTAPVQPVPVSTTPKRGVPTRLFLVDKPNAAQSVIQIGAPGIDRRSPDYAAVQVMNTILGGSFSSRLMTNLRETKAYTYGARSNFAYRVVPGPFIASAAVRTNVTDSSLVEFYKELRLIRDSLVSPVELERAKAYLEFDLPAQLESTSQIAGQLAALGVHGLSLDAMADFASKVRAVTAADVQRVARAYLPVEDATIVIVGDLARIRPGIEALRLGPIAVLEASAVAR